MLAGLVARAALLLALSVPFAGPARGHAVVVETEPADGAVLTRPPERIRIVFNEPVSLVASQVLDAAGRNVVAEAASVRDAAVEIPLPPSLPPGAYVASFRVVSVDGHPVGGSLVFSIGEASASPAPAAASPHDLTWRLLWTGIRAVLNAGLLGSAGGVMYLFAVGGAGAGARRIPPIVRRLALLGLLAAGLSVGVQGGLLIGGPIEALLDPVTWRTGYNSAFGRSAVVASAGAALVAAGMRWPSLLGRAAAAAGALLALIGYALAGHVVTAGPRWLTVPAVLAHTSCVAFWIGSLLPLRPMLHDDGAAIIVQRFSRLAVAAVSILAVAGLVMAALQVRGFAALVTTTYGFVLLAKLALVAALLALAAVNKWRLTPALARGDPGSVVALRRTIAAELAVAFAILIATAALGTTPPPRALASDREHRAMHEHPAHGLSLEMASAGRRATLTFASADAGPNELQIAISDEAGNAAEAAEVTFTAANPAAGVEPIRQRAVPVRPGVWKIERVMLVPAGKWSVGVEALVSDFEKATFEGTVDLR